MRIFLASLSLALLFNCGGSGGGGGGGAEAGEAGAEGATIGPAHVVKVSAIADGFPEIWYDYTNDNHQFKFKSSSAAQHQIHYIITKDEYQAQPMQEAPFSTCVNGADSDCDPLEEGREVWLKGTFPANVGASEVTWDLDLEATGTPARILRIHFVAENATTNAKSVVGWQLIPAARSPFISKEREWHCGFKRTITGFPTGAMPLFMTSPVYWFVEKPASGPLRLFVYPNFNWACDPASGLNRFNSTLHRYQVIVRAQAILNDGPSVEMNMTNRRMHEFVTLPADTGYRFAITINRDNDFIFSGGDNNSPSDIPNPIEITTNDD